MPRRLFKIEGIAHASKILTVDVVELVSMEPEGLTGEPHAPPRFRLRFLDVVAFHVEPEIQNRVSGSMEEVHPFLYLETDSKYVPEMAWAASMYAGIDDGAAQAHYVAYTENLVMHILSPNPPEVTAVE